MNKNSHDLSKVGRIGVYSYIGGFAFPFEPDIPLIVLSLTALVSTVFNTKRPLTRHCRLIVPVVMFLGAAAASLIASKDINRSARHSVVMLPAVLLFLVIREHFRCPKQIRFLCIVLTTVSLGLSCMILWTAWHAPLMSTYRWASDTDSAIIIVPNDSTLLGLICPMSLVLIFLNPRKTTAMLAALSIGLSICAMTVLRSRIAVITAIAAIVGTLALARPKLSIACGLIIIIAALSLDGLTGFALLNKFGHSRNDAGITGRILLWSAAWSMFLEAPILGQGVHSFNYEGITWPHNLYLEALAEQGIVGLFALILLLVSGLKTTWDNAHDRSNESGILGAALFAGLAGLCFAGFFELSFIRQWVLIVLFVLLGVSANLPSFRESSWGNLVALDQEIGTQGTR